MKILQVTPFFYPAWAYGGIPRVVYELSKSLVKAGNELITLTTDVFNEEKRYGKREDVIDGVKTLYFPNISNTAAYNYQIYLPMGMRKWLSENINGIDIAHMHGHRHFLNNIALRAFQKKKIPYVFSGHGTVLKIARRIALKSMFDIFWGNKILKNASHFIAVSKSETDQYLSLGVPREKISIVHNGINLNAFSELPAKGTFREKYNLTDKKIVLYLGQITQGKGIEILVRAVDGLPVKNLVLIIAGNDMGFKPQINNLIKKLRLKEKVIFTGLLINSEKLSAYVDADVLVYPYAFDAFGLVPFEALMCGTPVIVSDDCGCGEVIKKIGGGYAVKYGDITGLRNTILEVLKNREEAQEKVQQGQAFIKQNLGWDKISLEIIEVYKEVLVEYGKF